MGKTAPATPAVFHAHDVIHNIHTWHLPVLLCCLDFRLCCTVVSVLVIFVPLLSFFWGFVGCPDTSVLVLLSLHRVAVTAGRDRLF